MHDGLDYQAWVTVLAAVEFLVIQDSAAQLMIEPPSHEDIEGDIHRPLSDAEPTPSESGALTDQASESYTLVIQSKRRDNGTWTSSGIASLLSHGGEIGTRRPSASNRLSAHQKTRYLLATSGHLVDTAAKLRIDRFGEWPDLSEVEARFQIYTAGDQCRVAVFDGLTEANIRQRLDDLCRSAMLMPFDVVGACLADLFGVAQARGRSDHPGIWSKVEVEEVLVRHGALLPGRIDLEDYVEPQNFLQIHETLEAQQAILILGPSGTGKSRTAERLHDQLRAALDGARLVRRGSSDGPGSLNDAVRKTPVIIYLDDPWGPVALADYAQGWTKALQQVKQNRRRDVWLIITSRSDVYRDAQVPEDAFAGWKFTLDASAYGPAERREILRRLIKVLPLRLRAIIEPSIERAVDELTTPLEIRTFVVSAAQTLTNKDDDFDVIGRSLRLAKDAQYKDVVAAQIAERKDGEAATILWLLFKGKASLTLDEISRARRATSKFSGTVIRLESLVHFLRTGQNLDQIGDHYSYAHPQVEAGLKTAALADAATFETTGARLIEALSTHTGGGALGPLFAARILASVVASDSAAAEGLIETLSEPARRAIDTHLLTALRSLDGKPFRLAFQAAAEVGTPGITHFDLARWFLQPRPLPPKPDLGDLMRKWLGTPAEPSWKVNAASDPTIRDMLAKAVVEILGEQRDFYPEDFGSRLAELGVDLTDAFGTLAHALSGHGYDPLVHVAINGALPNLASLEDAVRSVQRIYSDYVDEEREGGNLDRVNGVYDDEYAEHFEVPDEGDWAAGEIARAWVRAKRQTQGWKSLSAFPNVGLLGWSWAEAIEGDPTPVDAEEFASLASAVKGSTRERAAWRLAANRAETSLVPFIKKRLEADTTDVKVRGMVRRACAIHDLEGLADEQSRYLAAGQIEPILALQRDLLQTHDYGWPCAALEEARLALAARLPAPFDELARAVGSDLPPLTFDPKLSDAAAAVTTNDSEIAARLLKLTGGRHPNFDHLYDRALDGWSPSNSDCAHAALDMALKLDRSDLVYAALAHPVGTIVRRAIEAVGETVPTATLATLPGMRGSIVRRAVIAELGKRDDDAAATDALLKLCGDTYNTSHSGTPVHELARVSAKHLEVRATLAPTLLKTIKTKVLGFADAGVRRPLMRRLARESADYRQWLWALVIDDERPLGIREDAAVALLNNGHVVEAEILDQITLETLLALPGSVSVLMTLIVARRRSAPEVKQLATRINDRADRRGLIVLLGRPSTPEINDYLRTLLGDQHPAAALVEETGRLAPWDALDEIAEQSIVTTIQQIFKRRFEAKPKPVWPPFPPRPQAPDGNMEDG